MNPRPEAANVGTVMRAYTAIFVVLFAGYAVAGYDEPIPSYMTWLQASYFVVYTLSLHAAVRLRTGMPALAAYIFIYSLLCAAAVRWLSWHYMHEPFFGGMRMDSGLYDSWGALAAARRMTFGQYIAFLRRECLTDDFGMACIIYWAYDLFGSGEWGRNMLLAVNAAVIAVTALRIDGIMRYFGTDERLRRFFTVSYCCFPFLSLTAAVGLKENFFIFVILSAFRHMFRFLESRSPASLALAVMYAACCIFFRIAVCAITCVALCTALASRRSNRRTMLVLMAAGAAGGVLVLGFIMPYVFGVPLETILSITEARTAKSNDTLGNGITWVISSLATVCGPFANFSRMAEYSMVHGAGCLLKGVTGFPLLWGVWRSLREMQWRYYSLAVYFFIHVLMLILAGVSLDMRYQLTLFPLTMPFTALALGRRRLPRAFAVYCLGLLLLTILYNGR